MAIDDKFDLLAKILLLGDSSVGKTCILLKISSGTFSKEHVATIGIDFRVKTLSIDGMRVKLHLWDSAGQERFKSLTEAYYRNAQGIAVVYDVTNRASFDHVTQWLANIQEHAGPGLQLMLIGNKCDVSTNERLISKEEGQQLAEQFGISWVETSAFTGENVEAAFVELVKSILRNSHTTGKMKQYRKGCPSIRSQASVDFFELEAERRTYGCCGLV